MATPWCYPRFAKGLGQLDFSNPPSVRLTPQIGTASKSPPDVTLKSQLLLTISGRTRWMSVQPGTLGLASLNLKDTKTIFDDWLANTWSEDLVWVADQSTQLNLPC